MHHDTVRRRRKGERPTAPSPAPTAEVEAPSLDVSEDGGVVAVRVAPRPEPPPRPETPGPRGPDLHDLAAIASMDPAELAAALGGSLAPRRSRVGDRVEGVITAVGKEDFFVDIGAKSEGRLDRREGRDLSIGDTVELFVLADDDGIRLSRYLSGPGADTYLEDAASNGTPVRGRVTGRNPGGYDIALGTVRAFCPASHIDRIASADPDTHIDREYDFLVLEAGDRVVVSRRALQEASLSDRRAVFLQRAQVGSEHDATIISVQPWGAYVDIDGVEARLPRREVGSRAEDLTTVLQAGQALKVRLVEIDPLQARITVSARGEDPWISLDTRFPVGGTFEGRVVGMTEFGAFVELAPGLDGLLHASRLGAEPPGVGDAVRVRLISVDHERRRLALELEGGVVARPDLVGEVTGLVREVRTNGLVVDLPDRRRGWLPAREAEIPPGTLLAQRFRTGHPITARVLSVDDRGVVLTQKEDEGAQRADWGAQATPQASMGTLGDLLRRKKR